MVVGDVGLLEAPGEHLACFSRDLAGTVAPALARAAAAGHVLLLIATPERAAALVAAVPASHDPADVVVLDAEATLGRICVDGRPDARAFADVVAGPVHEAARRGRSVTAYGEMVALLWDRGDVAGVMALEELWQRLCATGEVRLLCGYHAEVATAAEDEEFAALSALHTALVAAGDVRIRSARFVPDPTTAAAVRALVADTLCGCAEHLIDDAVLAASELATNAVLHAGSSFAVAVRCVGGRVTLAVADSGGGEPVVKEVDPSEAVGGRGMAIVASVAHRWGVRGVPDGKVVWAGFAPA